MGRQLRPGVASPSFSTLRAKGECCPGPSTTSRRRLQLRGPLRRHCRLSLTLTRSHRWSRSRSYRPSLTTSHWRSRCARSRRWTTQHYVDWALGNQSCTPPHSSPLPIRRIPQGGRGRGGRRGRTMAHIHARPSRCTFHNGHARAHHRLEGHEARHSFGGSFKTKKINERKSHPKCKSHSLNCVFT